MLGLGRDYKEFGVRVVPSRKSPDPKITVSSPSPSPVWHYGVIDTRRRRDDYNASARDRTMLKVYFLLSFFILLNSSYCDPQKQDQRLSSLESEVKQLKDKVAKLEQKQAARPEHNYELRKEGSRTFRFDPATGDMCIQLTSPADWKIKETRSKGCDCTDAFKHWEGMSLETDQLRQSAQNYYDHAVKSACGT
jgi:hypothetical protein